MRATTFVFVLCLTVAIGGQYATAAPLDICRRAARQAEVEFSIPHVVLQSIALVETGRSQFSDDAPWPWTVNINGHGSYFATRNRAEEFVIEQMRLGHASVDIGCFQINTKWHGHRFKSITEIFDPYVAARYAASHLSRLKSASGNWKVAIMRYHSADGARGRAYAEKVSAASQITSSNRNGINSGFQQGRLRNQVFVDTPTGGVPLLTFVPSAPMLTRNSASPLVSRTD